MPSPPPPQPLQRVIRSRSQSMDAMGLSNKKPNTVSTSHSGSFAPNNPDLAKAAGIVSALHRGPSALPCLRGLAPLPPLPCCTRVPIILGTRLSVATTLHGGQVPRT